VTLKGRKVRMNRMEAVNPFFVKTKKRNQRIKEKSIKIALPKDSCKRNIKQELRKRIIAKYNTFFLRRVGKLINKFYHYKYLLNRLYDNMSI
jgi:hypothetical protein